MNEISKKYIRDSEPYLVHYNHNHDKLGRFARSIVSATPLERIADKISERKAQKEFDDSLDEIRRYAEKEYEKLSEDEKKNVIQVSRDKLKYDSKDLGLKSMEGGISIDTGYSYVDDIHDYWLNGKSSTRKSKQEVRSENGIHLIKERPTTMSFSDVGHDSGAGLDKTKIKLLDSFAKSKTVTDSINAGRKFAANKNIDVYKDWSDDPISKPLSKGYNSDNLARDLTPDHISFTIKNGKPEISGVGFIDMNDNLGGHWFWVDYEKGKPKRSYLEG